MSEKLDGSWQDIGSLYVKTDEHNRFGTDAVLLENFANAKRNEKACDIGTGCGIIPMLMKRNNHADKVFAVDVQNDAIELLKQTIDYNKTEDKIIPVLCDIKDLDKLSLSIKHASLDLVVSNPPYYKQNNGGKYKSEIREVCREETMCSIYDVTAAAKFMLKYGGRLCMCYKPERLCDCIDAMRKEGIEPKKMRFVKKDEKSKPWLVLVEGKRGANAFLEIQNPLIMNSAEGKKELESIYALK